MENKNQVEQSPKKSETSRYLVAGSNGLIEALKELNFHEIVNKGSGYSSILIFKKGIRHVKISYHILHLYFKDKSTDKEIPVSRGSLISEEFLKFFSNRSQETILNYVKER